MLYSYTYKTGIDKDGSVLTIDSLENDINNLLLKFDLAKRFNETTKMQDASEKIYNLYENADDGISAFKILMTNGNTYNYHIEDKIFVCTAVVGFLGLPSQVRLNRKSKILLEAFYNLALKYHKDLSDLIM